MSSILYAKNLQDVFYQIKTVQGLQITGGCTSVNPLPPKFLSIRNVAELKAIDKHERYFDFGPAVTIDELEAIGEKLPPVLSQAVKSVGNARIKNMGTLGGNICQPEVKGTLYAPLLALDAKLEYKNEFESVFIPLTKVETAPKDSVLTKIRVPIQNWEVEDFKRVGPYRTLTEDSASFAFLADTQSGILTTIRIAFAGSVFFRSLEAENALLGSRLPLHSVTILQILEKAADQFDLAAKDRELNPVLRNRFLNLLKYSLEQLT